MAMRKKYIEPDGTAHYTLPQIWNNTSPITEETITRLGWTIQTEGIPDPPPPPTRYSKYKLVLALGDKWAAVKQAITANGYIDLWDACQELASDNSLFQAAKQLIITMYPDLDAETILQEAQL